MRDDGTQTEAPRVVSSLAGRCPRCGQGRLFAGYLATASRCDRCGLDLSFADSADGPAFFIMFGVGALVVLAAFIVEFAYQPPYWVHALLWLPLICGLSLVLLRPIKGLMIALQYRQDAGEGRVRGPNGKDR